MIFLENSGRQPVLAEPRLRERSMGRRPKSLRTCERGVQKSAATLGRPLKVLIGKPGLDGHSNGAEQIAVWCRDAGMEVVYEGIRLSPEQNRHQRA